MRWHRPGLSRTACLHILLTYVGRLSDTSSSGPGFRISDFESNRIIAQLQVDGARTLMNGNLAPVTGAVRSVHTYVDMCVAGLSPVRDKVLDAGLQGHPTSLLFQTGRRCKPAQRHLV